MAQHKHNISRADQVRARRLIEPVRRKQVPAAPVKSTRNAESSSRVISRRMNYTTTYAHPAKAQNRKRIYVPSGQPGTEVRLPAIPQFNFSWRILSALLAILAAVGCWYMFASDEFAVSEVKLDGAKRVSAQEVINSLNVTGASIINVIPTDVVEDIMSKFPDFQKVSVAVVLPNTLDIAVEERVPTITWKMGEEHYLWIDAEGYAFPARGEPVPTLIVDASGEPPHPLGWMDPLHPLPGDEDIALEWAKKPSVDPEFARAVLQISEILPEDNHLLYDPANGLGWKDVRGWQVYFGTDLSRIDLKLEVYDRIVESIMANNLQPVLISIEFLHAPYYRLE
jgi:cell division protein FtsQ